MQLQHLRYFCEVAKYNSITRAAETLYISQPSLSKIIRNLEVELGFDLFVRNGKNLKLNKSGRIFYESVDKGLSCIADGSRRIRERLNILDDDMITVCAYASSIGTCDIISSFMTTHPGAHITYNISGNDNMLMSRNCDMYLLASTDIPPNMEKWELITESLMLVVPINHPLANRDWINLSEAANCLFAICDHGQIRSITNLSCTNAGFVPKVALSSNDAFALRDFVRSGIGVAMVPQVTWGNFNTEYSKTINIKSPVSKRTLYLCTWKEKYLPALAVELRDAIISFYKQKAPLKSDSAVVDS